MLAALLAAGALIGCPLVAPADGPLAARFAPQGRYAGHWGIDLTTADGTGVRAPAAGVVTFAGSVAGVRTVTVDHGGFRSSVSYLRAVLVAPGSSVQRGQLLGLAGRPHGRPGVHLSVRAGPEYVDPLPWIWCHAARRTGTLRLLPPPSPYAARRQ